MWEILVYKFGKKSLNETVQVTLFIVEVVAVGPGASETSAYMNQIRRCHNPEGTQQIFRYSFHCASLKTA